MKPMYITDKRGRKRGNVYSPEYISLRDGISIDEAVEKIAEYKSKKATSLAGFIQRHGETEGARKFHDFQKTSVSRDKSNPRFNRECSRRCVEYYLSRGLAQSQEEASQLVSEYQLRTSGVHRSYYEALGMGREAIDLVMSDINHRKLPPLHTFSYDALLNRGISIENCGRLLRFTKCSHPDKRFELAERQYVEMFNAAEHKFDFILGDLPLALKALFPVTCDREALRMYRNQVKAFSVKHNLSILPGFGSRDELGRPYELDHKFSIKEGSLNSVPPIVMACLGNLHFIPRSENAKKHTKCIITLDTLYQLYEEQHHEADFHQKAA